MRSLICLILLFAPLVRAEDAGLAGTYAGDWKSASAGLSGLFRLSLEARPEGAWKCEVSFTLGGAEIKTKMRAVKVRQSKLEASYEFELQGAVLRSEIIGLWNGKAFDGQYQTGAVDAGGPADEGTWTAMRVK
jgi:hypothetical protein